MKEQEKLDDAEIVSLDELQEYEFKNGYLIHKESGKEYIKVYEGTSYAYLNKRDK